MRRLARLLVSALDLEGRADENVVGPVHADVVHFVLTVAQLDDPVDDPARVGRERGFGGSGRGGAAHDRAGSFGVARRDLANLLDRGRYAALERDDTC